MLKKYIFTLLIFSISFSFSLAQSQPVIWTIKKSYVGEGEFILDFVVEIDSSWHMYGHLDRDLPRPLGFNLSTPSFISLKGDLRATTNPLTTPTKFFKDFYYLPHYKGTVAFRQRIKIDKPEANPYVGVQIRFGAYKTVGDKTSRFLRCYCYYFDLKDLSTIEIANDELNECSHKFDFCVPKSKKRQEWYPLEVVERSNSQDYITWEFYYKKIGQKRFQIIAEADISNTYRLISQADTASPAGLLFDFLTLQNCSPTNYSIDVEPSSSYYIMWKKELDFITGKVKLIHEIEVDPEITRAVVNLNIRYMICDDLICMTENNIKVKFPLIQPKIRTVFVATDRNSNQEGDFTVAKEIE